MPTTDRLQWLSNATRKFDRGLMQLHHSELLWLDVPKRSQYKLGVTVHQCLQSRAPQYLVECMNYDFLELRWELYVGVHVFY